MKTVLANAVSLACVRCDKPLRPEAGFSDWPAHQGAWDYAMVHDMHAGFGSRYDCGSFIVGLCDDCIGVLLSRGSIADVTEMSSR